MANAIPGDFLLRFMTSHPKDATERLFDVMARCEKVAPVIHLPFQSGNTRVLQAMNRRYTREQYLDKVRACVRGFRTWCSPATSSWAFPERQQKSLRTPSLWWNRFGSTRCSPLFTLPERVPRRRRCPTPFQEEEKSVSFSRLVEAQNRISLEKHQAYIGTVQRCLVVRKERIPGTISPPAPPAAGWSIWTETGG